MSIIPLFYVYILCRPDGRPFYVGKENEEGKRQRDHEQEARSGHHCHRCHAIRKIWRNGGVVLRYTKYATDNEADAYQEEKRLIALYGRRNLTNATDGGEGQSGRIGELSGAAKLTWQQVKKLRRRYAEEPVSARDLAEAYGVTIPNIESIVYQRTWGKDPTMPTKRLIPVQPTEDQRQRQRENTPKGEHQRDAKLTWEKVAEIRIRYAASGISPAIIAQQYGVTPTVISRVLRNVSWHDASYDPSIYIPYKPAGRGERNQGARLTWEQIREIRARYQLRKVTAKMLAAEYGVSSTHIEKIIRRELWRE